MNKRLQELADYVDNDLILILSDEQRDDIISLATAALVADERVATRKEMGEALVNAAHRITPITVPEPKKEYGLWHTIKVYAAAVGIIIMMGITAFFYLSSM